MHKFLLAIFTAFLFLTSCGGDEAEKPVQLMEEPEDLIPEDKMVAVLVDVHLLEAVVGYKMPQLHVNRQGPFGMPMSNQSAIPVPAVDSTQKPLPFYDIFAKYGYTQDQYERSNEWYAQDAIHYSEMYDEVINELTRRQASEQQGSKPAVGDSTKT